MGFVLIGVITRNFCENHANSCYEIEHHRRTTCSIIGINISGYRRTSRICFKLRGAQMKSFEWKDGGVNLHQSTTKFLPFIRLSA